MNHINKIILFAFLFSLVLFKAQPVEAECLIGAFLSDSPTQEDISNFRNNYGKKPFIVMVFIDWGSFLDDKMVKEVYSQGCILLITWEPWEAVTKQGINYEGLLSGEYDKYISDFGDQVKEIKNQVFIRFAHEMNGNWYPWSGIKIGKDKFVEMSRHVKDIFDKNKVKNVKWIFSVNWEDVPEKDNYFMSYYPGDNYVDYIGIDGYNWGDTQSWSKWMSFKDIFFERYLEVVTRFRKPVLISEFSSASSGGNKARWLKEAMNAIKDMQHIKGFVLFNIDKEVDWSFSINSIYGKEFKRQLKDDHFRDKN